jgi:hypothetical protein
MAPIALLHDISPKYALIVNFQRPAHSVLPFLS